MDSRAKLCDKPFDDPVEVGVVEETVLDEVEQPRGTLRRPTQLNTTARTQRPPKRRSTCALQTEPQNAQFACSNNREPWDMALCLNSTRTTKHGAVVRMGLTDSMMLTIGDHFCGTRRTKSPAVVLKSMSYWSGAAWVIAGARGSQSGPAHTPGPTICPQASRLQNRQSSARRVGPGYGGKSPPGMPTDTHPPAWPVVRLSANPPTCGATGSGHLRGEQMGKEQQGE